MSRCTGFLEVACALLACVSLGSSLAQTAPATKAPFVEDHERAAVIRFQGHVAVPLELAYMNLLRQAQFCWGRTAVEGDSGMRWQIEDNLDLVARKASIILFTPSMGAGVAVASIRLQAQAGGTHLDGSALRSTPGAPHMGSEQIHLLQRWAEGEWTRCDTP